MNLITNTAQNPALAPTTYRPLSPTPRTDAESAVGKLGTILSFWAHPDDEAYLCAGLMRLALENGQRVVCVTATKGEHGTSDPFTWPPEQLAPARSVELAASLAVIADGLHNSIEHHWLDHRDGRCAEIRPEIGAAQIAGLLDRVQPDTVITFDAGGVTGHTDHQAVAEWTTLATRERHEVMQLDAVVPQSHVEHFDGCLDLDPFFYDGYPRPIADEDLHLGLVLDDDLWRVKDRALRAQTTQTAEVIEMFNDVLWKDFNLVEAFTRHVH